MERYIDMLIHEIIHHLFIQNELEIEKYFGHIFDKYQEEQFNTSIHILLHAIHKKVSLKFFWAKRLNQEIGKSSYYLDYKRSWEIVNKEGEDSIIKEFESYLDAEPKEKA